MQTRFVPVLGMVVLRVGVAECCTAGQIIAGGGMRMDNATAPTGDDYVAIDAGGGHGLALKRDGSMVASAISQPLP